MKKTLKITAIILYGALLSGCDDFLSRTPISSASPDTFWNTKEDADLWIAGTYDALQATLRTGALDWGESRSDNFVSSGVGSMQVKVTTNTLVAGDNDLVVLTSWKNIYTTISRCNYGLKYMPQMIENNIDGGKETYKDYMGQYYGLRALMYFYAIRVWGRVPLVGNTAIESLSQNYFFGRSPIDSCKKVILSDLDSCINNINFTNRKYYFSLGAAYALKTDVHMWFKEYDLAEQSIKKLEALNYYKWVLNSNEWKKIFTEPEGSNETIFTLYFEQLQDNGGSGIAQRLGSSSNTSTFSIAEDLFKSLVIRNKNGNIDARWAMCFDTITYASTLSNLQDKCGKYFVWDATQTRIGESKTGGFVYDPVNMCDAKIPIYRYADIQLLKAEIYCRKAEYQKALDIVNQVRARVGYLVDAKLTDFADPDTEVLNCVMEERRIEFFGEGKRWFDLIRVSNSSFDYFHKIMDPIMASRNGSADYIGMNEGRILFPIESTAFAVNPLLRGDQNPPYSE